MPDLFPRTSRTDVPIEESPVARYIIQPCVASAQTINEVTQLKAPIMPIIGSCPFSTLVIMMMVVVMVRMDKGLVQFLGQTNLAQKRSDDAGSCEAMDGVHLFSILKYAIVYSKVFINCDFRLKI